MSLGVEDETTEFVEGMEQLDHALTSMAAMLNRYHRACIYIGVGNDGEPNGSDFDDEDLNTIYENIKTKMNTRPEVKVELMADDVGRRYIRISASGYDIPYSYNGWFRVRRCCMSKSGGATVKEWKNLLTCGMKRHRSSFEESLF